MSIAMSNIRLGIHQTSISHCIILHRLRGGTWPCILELQLVQLQGFLIQLLLEFIRQFLNLTGHIGLIPTCKTMWAIRLRSSYQFISPILITLITLRCSLCLKLMFDNPIILKRMGPHMLLVGIIQISNILQIPSITIIGQGLEMFKIILLLQRLDLWLGWLHLGIRSCFM